MLPPGPCAPPAVLRLTLSQHCVPGARRPMKLPGTRLRDLEP